MKAISSKDTVDIGRGLKIRHILIFFVQMSDALRGKSVLVGMKGFKTLERSL